MLEQTLFSITACDRQTDRRIPTAITRISTAWTDAYKKHTPQLRINMWHFGHVATPLFSMTADTSLRYTQRERESSCLQSARATSASSSSSDVAPRRRRSASLSTDDLGCFRRRLLKADSVSLRP